MKKDIFVHFKREKYMNTINGITSVIDAVSILGFLTLKLGKKNINAVYVFMIFSLEVMFSYFLEDNFAVQMALIIFLNMCYCMSCLKGHIIDRFAWSVIAYVPYVISTSIVMLVLSYTTGESIDTLINRDIISFIMIIIITRTLCYLSYFIMLKKEFNKMRLGNFEICIIIALFLISIFLMCELTQESLALKAAGDEQTGLLLIGISIIGILAGVIILCIRIHIINNRLTETRQIVTKLNSQKELFKQVSKKQEEINIQRHDIKHMINIWVDMLRNNKISELEDEFGRYVYKLDSQKSVICYIKGNDIINYVICDKLRRCKKNNIKYNTEITTDFMADREMDISIILSNLLDNAIESSLKQEPVNRFIDIQMFKRMGMNNIIIRNYIGTSVLRNNPQLNTTNKDDTGHGYGIKSIKKLVEKYNGDINITEENNYFVVHIMGV